MASAITPKRRAHEAAPASTTPLERSPSRLERPILATISSVASRPFSAADFMTRRAPPKPPSDAMALLKASMAG